MASATAIAIPREDVEFYRAQGYLLARGLFGEAECDHLRTYFRDMVERGGDGWAEGEVDPNHPDPLKRYPRLLQPHRADDVAFKFMLDSRIREYLASFYGRETLAVQTMVYFKPPGAKGQALHQDQRYLRAEPGTCMAAWLALEDIDEENGCLQIIPGSQLFPVLCPGTSDTSVSFTSEMVPVPQGHDPINVLMKKGDILFFNGSLVHGSGPNHSKDRFRTIIVGHYIEGEAEKVAQYYFPVYRFDGTTVDTLEVNPFGGPCGVLVEKDGNQAIEMTGDLVSATAAH